MDNKSILVEGLGKMYHLGEYQPYLTLRDAIHDMVKRPFDKIGRRKIRDRESANHIWALKDVSFGVKQGEVVGVIGRNGSGKTTLLKILSRITPPTEGYARVCGRIASLLEVGIGFHGELTGRDNIYLNAALLGMKKKDITRKFDEIVDFAEIEKFIDTPIKHYSSGMHVRLAFAVAAYLEPDILLVDDLLAVGDMEFQKKCLGKMDSVSKEGRTVIIVSHNMWTVSDLCQRCIWIDKGHIVQEGKPQRVIAAYMDAGSSKRSDGVIADAMHDHPSGDVFFRYIMLLDQSGERTTSLFFGEKMRIVVEIEICRPVERARFIIVVEKIGGAVVGVFHSTDEPHALPMKATPGFYKACIEVPISLMPGEYSVNLSAKPAPGFWGVGRSWDLIRRAIDFEVKESSRDGRVVMPVGGIVRPQAQWTIERL